MYLYEHNKSVVSIQSVTDEMNNDGKDKISVLAFVCEGGYSRKHSVHLY